MSSLSPPLEPYFVDTKGTRVHLMNIRTSVDGMTGAGQGITILTYHIMYYRYSHDTVSFMFMFVLRLVPIMH